METPNCHTIFSELLRSLLLLSWQLLYRKSKFSNTYFRSMIPKYFIFLKLQYCTIFFKKIPKYWNNLEIHILCNIFVVVHLHWLPGFLFKKFRMSYFSDLLSVLSFTLFCFTVCLFFVIFFMFLFLHLVCTTLSLSVSCHFGFRFIIYFWLLLSFQPFFSPLHPSVLLLICLLY